MTNKNYNSFQDWITNQFTHNELADIANHGCVNGFHGLIYYSETTALYKQYKDDIWEIITDTAESLGYQSCVEFIGSLNGANVGGADQFENLLVWFAVETIAWQLTDGVYQE